MSNELIAGLGGTFMIVILVVAVIWTICWFVVPFYIIGIHNRLKEIRDLLKKE